VSFLVRELTVFEIHTERGSRTDFLGEAWSRPAGSLEESRGGGTAFLTGAVEGHAGAGLGLKLECGVADDFGKDQGCGGKGEIAVADRGDDCWIGWAGFRDVGELGSGRGRGGARRSEAVMGSVAAAAGGKISV